MTKYLEIMRPAHWSKNVFLFVGLLFGRKLAGPASEAFVAAASAFAGFFAFCLASSSMYILNDIVDRTTDLGHPVKRLRPIAAGTVSVPNAAVFSAFLAAVSLAIGFLLVRQFAFILIAYIFLTALYSVAFKKVMILDVIVIAVGFCLRAVAGAVVVGVFISPWLIICTFALCLFLGFGKRRGEIQLLGSESESFRRTLAGYSPELLDHMLNVTSGLAVVCFLLYATDDHTFALFGTRNLVYTTPFVLYCIFRFSALIQQGKYPGPVAIITRDLPFQAGFVLWVAACAAIIYTGPIFKDLWLY